ncbi:PD-(D/E)XK nuclease family protein [Vulcanisaeta souniana]|uniref:DUF3782 domain-containing protein n=1 Tax=Vulcanisaeta souniana JCM 11219 TaxID=1293586 RepID=A0A830DZ00_9CREN|nr:DUF3782 domain-containing protein [Vulcanisaeta souniana]BDR91783.1 hypothetical protein Vsou_08760 [Vulcanisaeta souniana JCM 11219]GGI70406.1 hypothetical protein GCM10007112_04230 [Vulcanisaeta souniana JCM 11219]
MGSDLRKELLRLLKEDEEFRYAVMGLLGISDLKSSVDNLVKAITDLKDIVAKQCEEISELRKAVEALSEDVRRHGEVIIVMQTSIEKLTSSVTALGYRYGLFTEEAFRESIKYLVSDLLKVYEVKHWTYYDSDGFVFGRPSIIDVDVLIRDNEHILVVYRVSIDRGDVAELFREGVLYERVNKVKPRLLIVGPVIRRKALELARELGVEVRASEVV